jgi:hypothetical protein
MPEPASGVSPQVAVQQEQLRRQKLDIKNVLPFDIYEGLVFASQIESDVIHGDTIQKRHVKGFYEDFWHVYHYVKNSVEAEKINPQLTENIDAWFKAMRRQSRNTPLILVGVELYLVFVKNLQRWGIGRLFEKSIDPPFMIEDMDHFDMLTEELDEEVIAQGSSSP